MTLKAIVFGTETHDKENPIIIEAAWIDPLTWDEANPPEGSTFCQRYNPGVPITYGAMAVHHIRNEDLVGCPPAESFKLPESVEYIIGHNIDFDWKAIGCPPVKRICSLALARAYLPNLDSHTQSALMYYFFGAAAKEKLKEAHSSLADVQNLVLILDAMTERCVIPGCSEFEELWELSEEARIPKK